MISRALAWVIGLALAMAALLAVAGQMRRVDFDRARAIAVRHAGVAARVCAQDRRGGRFDVGAPRSNAAHGGWVFDVPIGQGRVSIMVFENGDAETVGVDCGARRL